MRQHKTSKNILVTVAMILPFAGLTQEETGPTTEAEDTIDEITVMGARPLALMRAEVVVAEQAVYDLYNELNDDDDYDIICKKQTQIGSQIPKRVCQARMYRDAVSDATQDDDDDGLMTIGNRTRSSRHQKILIEKMRALSIEHPELLDALRTRYGLEAEFKAEKEQRYGD